MKLLTVKELSTIIKIKEKTLYEWAKRGVIPSFKLNGLLRFNQKDIEEWIKNSRTLPIRARKLQTKSANGDDIKVIVKRAIDSVKRESYNSFNGKPDQSTQKGGISGNL